MDLKHLWEKLEREEKLSEAEWEALKQQSDPKAQEMVSLYVRKIYEEQPSPSWQARLNERLSTKTSRRFPLKHALALAFAGVLALWIGLLVLPKRSPISSEELATQLLQWHEEAVAGTFLPPDSKDLASLPREMPPPPRDPVNEFIFGDEWKDL
jgi:hypothetical protein